MNALRAFEAVSRHLSYQLAAKELHVTPGAVKQLVSKLEATLGTTLVRRKGRGLELTREGAGGQEDLQTAMRYLSSSVAKMRPTTSNKLIVTVEASFATAWLVPKLDAFRSLYPDINVLIDSSQHIVDLHQGEVDVAIRYGVERGDGVIVRRLFADQIFPVCSAGLAAGPPVLSRLDDLAGTTLIHWDISQLSWARETKRWFTWESWLARVEADHLTTERGLHFSDYGLAVQAAVAGQGVVLASWPILKDALSAGLLTQPFLETVTTDIGYDLVTTPEAQKRPEVQAFTRWLVERAAQE